MSSTGIDSSDVEIMASPRTEDKETMVLGNDSKAQRSSRPAMHIPCQ